MPRAYLTLPTQPEQQGPSLLPLLSTFWLIFIPKKCELLTLFTLKTELKAQSTETAVFHGVWCVRALTGDNRHIF